jgi:hypothetical protein
MVSDLIDCEKYSIPMPTVFFYNVDFILYVFGSAPQGRALALTFLFTLRRHSVTIRAQTMP